MKKIHLTPFKWQMDSANVYGWESHLVLHVFGLNLHMFIDTSDKQSGAW